jgi:hypothetical protein
MSSTGGEGVVVKACVRSVSCNASESSIHRVEGLLPILDARQEQPIVKVCFNRVGIQRRFDLFLPFFFYQGENLRVAPF